MLTIAGIVLFVVSRALHASAQPAATGATALVGLIGTASTDLSPEGTVFVRGELWTATGNRPLQQGERVRVLRVDGLRLLVDKVEDSGAAAQARPKPARPRRKTTGG